MTSSPTLRNRQVRKADASTPGQSKAKAHTVIWREIPGWQFENEYILSGYRPENADYAEIFSSITFLHNETGNVYTHLIGALLLPPVASIVLRYLARPQFLDVSFMGYFMFGVYFWCAEVCLVLSTLYHLLRPHSHRVEVLWHGLDMLGIVIVNVGTFSSGIYYVFYCDGSVQRVHLAIILTASTVLGGLSTARFFKAPRWRKLKVTAFVALGSSSLIPLVHGVERYGLGHMVQYSGMKWYLLELLFYGIGAGLYASRFPERLDPGRFDIWGSSHQIFHVAILCAMSTHATALLQGFTTSHTQDAEQLQGKAGVD
ncbi:hypothetical protein Purlil1_13776 [Purpureocillium lilacinum]|uniref:MPR-like GPCR protein n=1 Tax=Purpureocillium lilacinum TaxID=33203 RepID=A0ABR0BD41_PURLI|nr:hypothetical protein Purlil1_13776 [Purpureocillium lilacinum]